MTLASTTHPEHLTAGLNSYVRAPIDAAELDEAQVQVRSPLIGEAVRIGRAKDCWGMLREGFLVRRDDALVRRDDSDEDEDEEERTVYVVAPYAWGVLAWWIELFEADERVQCADEGSDLKQSHSVQATALTYPAGVPDRCATVGCASADERGVDCLSVDFESLGFVGIGFAALKIGHSQFVNASATYAVTPRILVRTTTDQLQTIPSSAFKRVVEDLVQTRSPFPTYLYTRFCFCLASLYLARTGAGVSESGVFGAVSSSKRGPRARPRISGTFEPMGESQMESQMESQTESQMEITAQVKPAGVYPYPVPSLQTTQALLRSTPKTRTAEAFGMHAVARWTILRALVEEIKCGLGETWMPVNDLSEWNVATTESVRVGFNADVGAGANAKECTLWGFIRDQWDLVPL
ncbi:hypothetical protein FRC07_002748 [Ceratobasidium sp. 392]|nr:hypothetical protein FRC07_002748 [Ceratobasidium sp. 392]